MDDELLLLENSVAGMRWRSLLANAAANDIGEGLAAGDMALEGTSGELQDCLLDSLCSLRGVYASRADRREQSQALMEAGESLIRLSVRLADLRCQSLRAAVLSSDS